jgi:hypothetical protein
MAGIMADVIATATTCRHTIRERMDLKCSRVLGLVEQSS